MLCARKFEFDAAHRVLNHGSKCRYLHGHRYVAEVTCHTDKLNNLGFCIDFGDVKAIIGKWIDDNWDHNTILNPLDPLLQFPVFNDRAPYIMPIGNPSAENMAKHLLEVADSMFLGKGVRIVQVRLYETPNCWSDYHNPFFHPKE